MRVLIVDDSVVYRSQIRAALEGEPLIEVVGVASNGKIALEMLEQKSVDVVTLDMEMPVLNGLETLKEIRAKNHNVKVIVFSSLTVRGSEAALDALTHGAQDFVTKPTGAEGSMSDAAAGIKRSLVPKILQFLVNKESVAAPSRPAPVKDPIHQLPQQFLRKELATFHPSAVVIASSTGGPSAHEELFSALHGELRCPIFIAQHMPPVFTATFAKRIQQISGIPCAEGIQGEVVQNKIYVAPGDYHMTLGQVNGAITIQLDKKPQRNSVRPAADFLFESAAALYRGKCMSVVLTGMGEDGLDGARAVKAQGGGVMIQSEASCVVFGMPGAVWRAGLQDGVGALPEIHVALARMVLK